MRKSFYLLLFVFASCYTSNNVIVNNYAFLYNKNINLYHPEFTVYHYSADSSRLYFKINNAELLYDAGKGNENSRFRLSYELLTSLDENKFIDSAYFSPSEEGKDLSIIYKTYNFPLNKIKALMVLKLHDLNRNTTTTYYLNLNKEIENSSQNFLVKQPGNIFISNYSTSPEPITIESNNLSETQLTCKYYYRKFEIADPPFGLDGNNKFDYSPDSVFKVSVSAPFSLQKEGFYFFSTETESREGLTIYRYAEGFPNITSPLHLIEPLRYITTRKEFEELMRNKDKRSASDDFWLGIGGDPDRTKELIRKYYGRVVEANRLFTSYKEGWKTDRGMIFTIFGKPNIVYRTSNSESWIYGEESNLLSTNFTFIKVINPFTDNDYTLSRSPLYQNSWYAAIESWRSGRAYND